MGSKNAKTGKTPKGGTLWDLVVFEISYVVKASEFTPPLPPLYQVRFGLGQVRFVLVAFKSLETMYQTLASFGIWLETPLPNTLYYGHVSEMRLPTSNFQKNPSVCSGYVVINRGETLLISTDWQTLIGAQ